jgi:chaperonin GroES
MKTQGSAKPPGVAWGGSTVPIKPLEYKVLVEVKKVDGMTKGGILIPDSVRERQQQAGESGTLVAIGATAFKDPEWEELPEIGDDVLYNRYAGVVVRHAGKEYRLINDKELIAIVTNEFSEGIK